MFRLLAAVPASAGEGEADTIDLAFQSVQLTCRWGVRMLGEGLMGVRESWGRMF